jgi:hypothetical protein
VNVPAADPVFLAIADEDDAKAAAVQEPEILLLVQV